MKIYNPKYYNFTYLINILSWSMSRKRLSRAAIFLIIISCTSGSLYANTQTNNLVFDQLYEELDFQGESLSFNNLDIKVNKNPEYHTFKPGKEPPITLWTLFPGPKSNVVKATLITCKTASQFFLQHLVADGCQEGSLI